MDVAKVIRIERGGSKGRGRWRDGMRRTLRCDNFVIVHHDALDYTLRSSDSYFCRTLIPRCGLSVRSTNHPKYLLLDP